MKTLVWARLAAAPLLLAAAAAQAVPYDFTLTGDYTASFRIDSNPVATVLDPDAFLVEDVSGTFDGIVAVRNVSFYTPVYFGGLAIFQPEPFVGELSVFGAQVFAGPIDAPTFLPGSYDFTGFIGEQDGYSVRLVISAVPEPGTWAMAAAGLALLGAAAFRRREAAKTTCRAASAAGRR
jgi:hypothetical protein